MAVSNPSPARVSIPAALLPRWWRGLAAMDLLAEGVIPNIPVTPPVPWALPPLDADPTTPEIDPLPLPPGFEVRLRVSCPVRDIRDLVAVQVFLVPVGTPLPLPQPLPPILPEPNPTMAYMEIRASWLELGQRPQPTLGLVGRVVHHNPQFPGFGDQTGAVVAITAGFAQGPRRNDLHDAGGERGAKSRQRGATGR